MVTKHNIVNFFLFKIDITDIHLLSFASFNKLGYKCVLWCYPDFDTTNVPKYVEIKNAEEIHPKLKMGNIRFADYMRYKIIYKHGGIYSDTDNIIFGKLPKEDYIFSADNRSANNHLFKCPKNSKFLKHLIDDIERSGMTDLDMMKISGSLLNRIHIENKQQYIIDYSKTYFFQRNVNGLHSFLIDFESLKDIYTIHLFESSIRIAYRNSEIFKTNINNLKKFLL